jgi:Domain of unknown function (DUF4352)
MQAKWIVPLLALGGVLALAAAAPSFVINGKTVKLDYLEKNNKVYVEVQGFAKALGSSVTFDKSKNQYVIVSSKPSTELAGTTQLTGDVGEIGKAYTLGKNFPLNFTLRSAEFSVTRVSVGKSVYAPNANEKLLIVHFTVQNPLKQDQSYSYGNFKLTAVDSKDVNFVFDGYVAREGTSESLDMSLKPAQKIDVLAAWAVPAVGVIPKLIVQRTEDSSVPVVRYDLRGKVKPLPALFADPNDASGSSALAEVPASLNVFYPLKIFDVKLENISFGTNAMDQRVPSEGKRYLIANVMIQNATGASTDPAPYSYGNFSFVLKDSDGEKTEFAGYLIKISRDEQADGYLKPNENYRFRVYFELGQEVNPATLYVSDRYSRVYAFDLSSFK